MAFANRRAMCEGLAIKGERIGQLLSTYDEHRIGGIDGESMRQQNDKRTGKEEGWWEMSGMAGGNRLVLH